MKMENQLTYDIMNNGQGQLMTAAKRLLFIESSKRPELHPRGWDKDYWRKILELPLKERLELSKQYIERELNRLNRIKEINL